MITQTITKNWLIGFIEAEGTISYNKQLKKPIFEITQHISDHLLMEKIRQYLKINSNLQYKKDLTCVISETNKSKLQDNIIPLMSGLISDKKKIK